MTHEEILLIEGMFQKAKTLGIAGTRESKDGSLIPTYRLQVIEKGESILFEFWQDGNNTYYEKIHR